MNQNIFFKLLASGVKMAANRNLEPLFLDIMETAFGLLPAEHGYLVLLDEGGNLDFRVRLDNNGNGIAKPSLSVSYTVLNQVIQNREAALIGNASRHPDFLSAKSVLSFRLRSILCVPLIAHEKILGALYFENQSRKDIFSEDDLSILNFFAAQVSIAIDNATLNDKLEIRVIERTSELETEISERKLLEEKLKGTNTKLIEEIQERCVLEEKQKTLISELQAAVNEISVLRGILPICSYCKNIRDDEGSWEQMESYISSHSDIVFSHGVCPDCLEKVMLEKGPASD